MARLRPIPTRSITTYLAAIASLTKRRSAASLLAQLLAVGGVSTIFTAATAPIAVASEACPAALNQLTNHQTAGDDETLASVAATYNLQPETLLRFNRDLSVSSHTQALPVGTALVVPPFNGRVVEAIAGDSWQSLAERNGSRADVLFEVNGCASEVPSQVFVPGATPIAATAGQASQPQLPGYPLSQPASIVLSYGWQPHSTRDELVFNSGVAFTVDEPMEVRSVGPGTVAFVGDREGYGRLLVINHPDGLQTRYANLSDISVSTGQSVAETTVVGSVGQAIGTPAAAATGATYLYFEVRTNSPDGWVAQDPGKYLPALELR